MARAIDPPFPGQVDPPIEVPTAAAEATPARVDDRMGDRLSGRVPSGMLIATQMAKMLRERGADALHLGWERACRLGAVGPDDRRGRQYGAFGEGSCIAFPPGTVFGQRWIRIGSRTLIGPQVSLSAGMAPGQAMVTDPVIAIGDRCVIGRGSQIVGHLSIEIGDDVQTGPYVYITDQNHSYEALDEPIGLQWPTEQPVRVGSGSWLGAGVILLPGADVGEHVVVAAGSVVRGRIEDRCVVAGVPARVVRRHVPGVGWQRTGEDSMVKA
ncbi:MAG: acyltransferase [Acidimicrobiales bacterium]